jgi:outer membrane protein assembly factor BamA
MRSACLQIFTVMLLLLVVVKSHAQQWQLDVRRVDSQQVGNGPVLSGSYSSAQDITQRIRKIVPELQEQGYLAASVDSISIIGSRYMVFYFLGDQYRWGILNFDSVPAPLLLAAALNPLQFKDRPLNARAIARLSEKLLSFCDEHGYPFAKVWLDEVEETGPHKVNARLRVDKAELRKIDTIILNGDVSISASFLHRYLDIARGSVYNEKKLKQVSSRLKELPFLQESLPWVISFRPGDMRLSLFLKEKKANQLNALIGAMPNNLQTGKLLVTADVQIALQNLLGKGESISASYQNLQQQSPRMKADVLVPYLFKSPIGVEAHFDYFKNQLQFRKVSFQGGLRYQLSAGDFLRTYYHVLSNRIIEVDSAGILATHRLPANIDTRAQGLGFELSGSHTDYRLNPRKGWQGKAGITVFQRRVLPHAAILGLSDGSGFDFSKLYDTVRKVSYQYHLTADLSGFIPLGKVLTLKIGYVGGYIAAPDIFQNELFQVGGFKLLRGFDEQSIFANQYHVAVTELRLKFSQNSYAYLFSDNGWVETKFNNYDRSAWYNGFGLGTTLETKSGLFSIALALGRSDYIPLRFRESKISFGYVALF